MTNSPRLTTSQLTLWLNFIEHQVGFVLPSSQVNWVKSIIERHLQKTQLSSTDLLEAVVIDKSLYHALFDDILIPRTQFFRHIPSFELIAQYAQAWQYQQHLANACQLSMAQAFTAWSVGCSTGQEPVSIALTLKHALSARQMLKIYGSDFHQKSLQQAMQGDYSHQELRFVPSKFHSMLTVECEQFGLSSDLKANLHFFSQNLVEPSESLPLTQQQCQIIVCKNVLIYFRQFEQRDIISRLMPFLADDGLLILGVGEVLTLGSLALTRLPIATVNAYHKAIAPDWVKQLRYQSDN